MTPHDITLFLYNLTLIPITFFSVLFILMVAINVLLKRTRTAYPPWETLPFVTVQIPTFNDPVGARCVEHCLAFDYPRDRYEILIVDDSTSRATQELLRGYAERNGNVTYIHRENRHGFKPGALKHAMRYVRGEIIVLFDADWKPGRSFLKRIIRPFADPHVAVVQARQGFYNHRKNLISRFAAYTLMIYHAIIMPINNRTNTVFLCGTAGAVRTSAFKEVGGWNVHSITEDADLTVRLLLAGYRTVYVDMATPSEVPETLEGFLRQQMRWCYGNTRVFMDYADQIWGPGRLTWKQRLMITYVTLGNVIAPFVVLMTVFGMAGWFIGEPSLFNLTDLLLFVFRFALTLGFIIIGAVALNRMRLLREFKYLLVSAFTVGIILALANSVAFCKAILNSQLRWFCTPKHDNLSLVEE